jgi:hypothetical protein
MIPPASCRQKSVDGSKEGSWKRTNPSIEA